MVANQHMIDRARDAADIQAFMAETHMHGATPAYPSRFDHITTLALDMLRHTQLALEEAQSTLQTQKSRIAQLELLATTDELTLLLNRRGFIDAFERELDRARRRHVKGGLLLLVDLDNFKRINDEYGHAAGDAALQLIADTLRSSIRTMDVAARLGGDEFVLLFSNAETVGAVDRAQNLALHLNSLTLRWQGARIPVRASIGLRIYQPGDTLEQVLEAADCSMYAAKRTKAERHFASSLLDAHAGVPA